MVHKNQQTIDRLAYIFEATLGVSPRHAKKLADATLSESIARVEKITMRNSLTLSHFLNSTKSGVVLLTTHMEDYVHSILNILTFADPRKVIFLRRKLWNQVEESVFWKWTVLLKGI